MQFYTRFHVAESLNKDKVYDRHDNVDRVSYVDNTRLIQRFILEGQNLNAVRAKALNSGMYSDNDAFADNSEDIVVPVYKVDPAILDPMIDNAKTVLKSRVADKRDDKSNDNANGNSDLTERVVDNKED